MNQNVLKHERIYYLDEYILNCQKNDDASRHWWGFPMEIDLSDQSKKRFNQLYILNINNQIARLIQQKCNFANRFEWAEYEGRNVESDLMDDPKA